MKKRNVLNSPRLAELKKRRRRAILNKIFLSTFGLGAIFFLLTYVSRLPNLNIVEIQIDGNKTVDTEILKTTIERELAGKYLWLFPKTNILFYPQNAIKNELQDKFTRLNNIDLSIKNNKILSVSLTEREAKYTWCGNVFPEFGRSTSESSEKCYFLDENGYIFDEAPYFSGEVYFKFYGTTEQPLGSYFLKDKFKQLTSFKDILVDIGLKPVSLYVTKDGDVEIFLSRGASSTTLPKIIFKIDADFQNVAENLEAALTTEPLKTEFKNKYFSLQYIDLRFGNKVYTKFSK
jgi:hypothetical protein